MKRWITIFGVVFLLFLFGAALTVSLAETEKPSGDSAKPDTGARQNENKEPEDKAEKGGGLKIIPESKLKNLPGIVSRELADRFRNSMPVVKPDTSIDYKILVMKPDPGIDYKIKIVGGGRKIVPDTAPKELPKPESKPKTDSGK